jgi:hypothetical protein
MIRKPPRQRWPRKKTGSNETCKAHTPHPSRPVLARRHGRGRVWPTTVAMNAASPAVKTALVIRQRYLCLLLLLLPSCLMARLGENVSQINSRYGEPIATSPSQTRCMVYFSDRIFIRVNFLKGLSQAEEYSLGGELYGLSASQIKKLLQLNRVLPRLERF